MVQTNRREPYSEWNERRFGGEAALAGARSEKVASEKAKPLSYIAHHERRSALLAFFRGKRADSTK